VTTPESLFLLLGSQAQETLRTVETVIVDEIHSLAPTKRGVHLALSLERLSRLCHREPQRIGLSATVRPPQEVARFLGGTTRLVEIVDTLVPPCLDLQIVSPVADMDNPSALAVGQAPESILGQLMAQEKLKQGGGMGYGQAGESATSLWPAIYPQILQQIQEHRSTIVFVNSRGLCERLSMRLNELAGQELVRAHHGSVSHEERQQIEEQLKLGTLKGLVATSSLELGIDMGAVDLVLMVESPGSVARGLQRVGRAGHGVGQVSTGRIYPKFRGALAECAVVVARMQAGAMEPIRVPRNPLDVLCQQIAAIVASAPGPQALGELEQLVRGASPYAELSRELLVECLEMLSGRYPSTEFADLRPRINWDRDQDL
jgi:ATP-dependent Lhr-like helicase